MGDGAPAALKKMNPVGRWRCRLSREERSAQAKGEEKIWNDEKKKLTLGASIDKRPAALHEEGNGWRR